jgi:hypothetical protein
MPVTVYPRGTTIYKPEKSYGGYTMFPYGVEDGPGVILIDPNGRIAHQWKTTAGSQRARLLENGHLLSLKSGKEGGGQEYDWEGTLIWDCPMPRAHHDIFRKEDGNTLLLVSEDTPDEIRNRASDPRRHEYMHSDRVVEVNPDNEIVWECHLHAMLDIERCNPIPANQEWWAGPNNNTVADWTHSNTVQALPENRWYDSGDDRFKPGNVLISMRQTDTIAVIDRETKKIVWEYTGDYKGGMSGQHDSHMIEKGIPGEGNIIVYDNGASPYKDLAHAGCSFVLEIDPPAKKVVWVYDDREFFHSNFTSAVQRLANGNTLITEAWHGRIFEVTPEKETVWEYVVPKGRANRSYRYGYDHCPQLEAMERPEEVPVIPENLPEPLAFSR